MNDNLFSNACAIVLNRVLSKYQGLSNEVLDAKLLKHTSTGKYQTFIIEINKKIYTAKYTFTNNVFLQGTLNIISNKSEDIYSIQRVNDSLRIYTSVFDYDELFFVDNKKLIDIRVSKNKKEYISCMTLNFKNKEEFEISNTAAYISNANIIPQRILKALFLISGAIEYDITTCRDVISFSSAGIDMLVYAGTVTQVICINEVYRNDQVYGGEIKMLNSDFKQTFEYVNCLNSEHIEVIEFEKHSDGTKSIRRSYRLAMTTDGMEIVGVGNFKISKVENTVTFTRVLK